MVISDAKKKGGGGNVGSTENGASDVASDLIQLEELCSIFGINHKQRLKELGINPDKVVDAGGCTCLAETIHTLRGIKDSRFKELKECSTELIALWKTGMRSLSKTISLDQIYAVADAESSDEIKTEKLLSTHCLAQVAAEKIKFENTDKAKYLEKQKKLFDLMKQAHLTHSEVKFDPNATAPADLKAYKKKIIAVKKSITLAKCALLSRKEMVFRVERLQMARGDDLASIDVPSNNSENLPKNWTARDTKRMINLVFNVTDLEGAIRCYTKCFGMSILSEDYQDDFSYALLGYGPKDKNTSLLLVHEPAGAEKLYIGEGFGHVSISNADVINLTKAVEVSRFCKVAHKPCRLSGSFKLIAFVVDPCGLLFEVEQNNHPRNEPISRVMLYVEDADRSIQFYEKMEKEMDSYLGDRIEVGGGGVFLPAKTSVYFSLRHMRK